MGFILASQESRSNFWPMLLFFLLPVWIYWSGVWIFGFGYLFKLFRCSLFSLGRLVSRLWASKKVKDALSLIIVIAVGAIVSVVVKNHFYRAKATATLIEMEKEIPALASLKTHAPEVYQILQRAIVSSIENEGNESEINNIAIQAARDYISKKMLSVSDDIVVQYAIHDLNIAKDLRESAPEQCLKLMIGGRPTSDIRKLIKPEHLKAELAILNEIILAEDTVNPFLLPNKSDAEILDLFNPILSRQSKIHAIPSTDVTRIYSGRFEPEKSCDFMIGVMEEMLALPKNVAANIIRRQIANRSERL